MLKLKLTPAEFEAMIGFIAQQTQNYRERELPLLLVTVDDLVYGEYLAKWTKNQIHTWTKVRRRDKEYILTLRPLVAKTLYQAMQRIQLEPFEQLFLNKLDLAIVDFPPHLL